MFSKIAHICIGVSASGKSTWAKEMVTSNPTIVDINRDDIRAIVLKFKLDRDVPFTWKSWNWRWEDEVTEIAWEKINNAAHDPQVTEIIISDTNLSPARNKQMEQKLIELGFEVGYVRFDVSYHEAIRRDAERANGVGPSVIAKQFEQLHEMTIPRYVPDPTKPKAIVVDVDGTIAHMDKHRRPFEWDKVSGDRPDVVVIDVVLGMVSRGHKVIVVSGRDGVCYSDTYDWIIDKLGIHPEKLVMRTPQDNRSDDIVKREIFNTFCDEYNIVAVFDDRPKVVRMWRSLGLTTFALGNQHIEF